MATATPKKKVAALRVVAKRDGFRRAGRRFGAEPTDIPMSELKKAEIEALKGDAGLVVHEVEIEVDAPEGESKK